MAWALEKQSGQYATLDSAASIPANTPFEIEFELKWDNTSFSRVFGSLTDFSSRCLLFFGSGATTVRLTDNTGTSIEWSSNYDQTEFNVFRFARDINDDVVFSLNGEPQGTFELAGGFDIQQLFRQATSTTTSVEQLTYLSISVNGINQNNWDATTSDHSSSPPKLLDTVSGNDITGQSGMTDANWIDLGGAGNNSNVSFDVSSPEFSLSGTITNPSGNASDLDFDISKPEFSVSASIANPEYNADINFDVTKPLFSVDGSFTTPQITADVSFTIPAPEFNLTGSVTDDRKASIEFEIAKPEFSVSGSFEAPKIEASISFDIPAPEFSVAGEITEPGNNSDIDIEISSPEFSISGSVVSPGNNAVIGFTIPAPVWIGETGQVTVSDNARVTFVAQDNRVIYNAPNNRVITR